MEIAVYDTRCRPLATHFLLVVVSFKWLAFTFQEDEIRGISREFSHVRDSPWLDESDAEGVEG